MTEATTVFSPLTRGDASEKSRQSRKMMPIRNPVRSGCTLPMMDNIDRDCPNCGGMGHLENAAGADVVCPVCDGMGILFEDTDADDTLASLVTFFCLVSSRA